MGADNTYGENNFNPDYQNLGKILEKDQLQLLPKISSVEVIDPEGRVYTNWKARDVRISIQDSGRTLKIFIG